MGTPSNERFLRRSNLLILVNRNMGVLQTTVAEIVKVKEHQREYRRNTQRALKADKELARAYSIMPFVWCLGYDMIQLWLFQSSR